MRGDTLLCDSGAARACCCPTRPGESKGVCVRVCAGAPYAAETMHDIVISAEAVWSEPVRGGSHTPQPADGDERTLSDCAHDRSSGSTSAARHTHHSSHRSKQRGIKLIRGPASLRSASCCQCARNEIAWEAAGNSAVNVCLLAPSLPTSRARPALGLSRRVQRVHDRLREKRKKKKGLLQLTQPHNQWQHVLTRTHVLVLAPCLSARGT